MKRELRRLGIDVLETVPWGTNICYFYENKMEIFTVLVPYLHTGLENNEYCVWITSPAIDKEEAENTLREFVPGLSRYLESRQLEILAHTELYLKDGLFDGERVLHDWIDKLNNALAAGYEGMRIASDMTWLGKPAMDEFALYAEAVNNSIIDYPVLAICNFPLRNYTASQAIKVMSHYRYHIVREKDKYVLIGNSGNPHAEEVSSISEEFKSPLIENSPNAVTIINSETSIEYVNPAFEKLTGFKAAEVIGLKAPYPWWSEDKKEDVINFKRSLAQSSEEVTEVEFQKKNGEIFHVKISAVPIMDNGIIKYHVANWVDITGNKRTIEALQASEQRYRELLESINEAVMIGDMQGHCIDCNEALLDMMGYIREDFLALTSKDIIHPDYHCDIEQNRRRLLDGETTTFISAHCRKDGKMIPVEVKACMIEHQDSPAIIAIVRELSKYQPVREDRKSFFRPASGRHLTKLQESFLKDGFKCLDDSEIIELLLSLVLSSKKARLLANVAMERFQNLRDFLAAPPAELEEIGINSSCMFCIKLLHELPTEVLRHNIIERSVYQSSKEVFDYLYYSMRDLKIEVFKLIYLNKRSQIIDTSDLFEGTADYIHIRPREIVESAISNNSAGLIFVHNHPSGDSTPSKTDKQLTRDLVFIGEILQIKILDHIVIGDNNYFSFADEGLIQKYEDDFLNLKIRGVLKAAPPSQARDRVFGRLYSEEKVLAISGSENRLWSI